MVLPTIGLVLELSPFIFKASLHVIVSAEVFTFPEGAFTVATVLLVRGPMMKVVLSVMEVRLLLESLRGLIVLLEMRRQGDRPVLILGNTFILPIFVAHLSPGLSSAELSLRLEAVVPIDTDRAAVHGRTVQGVHSKPSFFTSCILDEAEAAGLHLDFVEAHDQIDHLATL